MTDPSQVGAARRHAVRLASELDFSEVVAGRVALVVTELGTNLMKHARQGCLLLATREREERHGDRPPIRHAQVEVVSIDAGPGIANLAQCMADGFTTGNSPGTGLGAIKRLADELDINSTVPGGTVAVARIGTGSPRTSAFRVGAIAIPKPGELVCGDAWVFASEGSLASALVADGLGHGPEAAAASRAAVAVFTKRPFERLEELMTQAHGALRSTRGAAVSAAHLDAEASVIRSVGAGNVMMRVVSGTSDRTLLGQHGTVGVQIRSPHEVVTAWPRHAALAIHSDGIMTRWPGKDLAAALGGDPSLMAALIMRDYRRDRDDATIVAIRRKD